MRQILHDDGQSKVESAHRSLEHYFQDRTDPSGRAETIYHANRLDWERGVSAWVEEFERAKTFSRFDMTDALSGVRNDLKIESLWWEGRTWSLVGEAAATLAQHQTAETAFNQAIAAYQNPVANAESEFPLLNSLGNTLQRLGDLLAQLGRHDEATTAYQQSISAFDHALRLAPDYISALWNRGRALAVFAQFQHQSAELHVDEPSCAMLSDAVMSLERALKIAPGHNAIQATLDAVQELRTSFGCERS